jgi:hypothetical protein
MKLDPKLAWPQAVAQAAATDEFIAEAGGALNKKETVMSGSKDKLRCPHCGRESDADDFAKAAAAPHVVIHKAVQTTMDSIIEDVMKRNPTMSHAQTKVAAILTPEFSRLVRSERAAHLGEDYRF